MDTMIGKIVDNYKIIEVLGRGGMGVVFKAQDMNLEKIVALKMIDPFLARDENFLRRFKTEAKALAKLENINIVSVYALRETELGLFMVMEYVNAKTVSEWIREKGKFSVKETVDISAQLLNAIGHTHNVGVIHRDIKPNNILLCQDGTVKVMDFGLAKVAQDPGMQVTVTQTSGAGTLHYMSPEQIKGLKNVDERSDIYSIGMSIYEMLAGRTPFEKGESEFAVQKQIVDGKIPSPLNYNPLIPKELVKVILKCLDKDPDKRFQNISELQKVLVRVNVDDEELDDKTRVILKSNTQFVNKETKSNKKLMLYSAAGLAAVILIAVIYFFTSSESETTPLNKESNSELIPKIDTKRTNNIDYAKLSVTSNPSGASVIIDGKSIGKTPVYADSLEVKNYSVSIRLNGYESFTKKYDLSPGENNISASLEPAAVEANATLILNMDTPGNILVDRKEIASGISDEVRKNVTAGKHNVTFIHPKYGSKETSINIGANQTKNITCYFNHQVNIQSLNKSGEALWGTIYVNNVSTDKTTPGDVILPPGTHKITVKRSGYTTEEDQISLTISPAFEKKVHSLVFHLK